MDLHRGNAQLTRIISRKHQLLNRRTMLRGAFGLSIGLPWLEVFQRTATAQQTDPLRLIVFIHANGVFAEEWYPDTAGTNFELKFSLEPLAPFRDRMIVLSGIDAKSARKDSNGGSGHTVAGCHLLCGADSTPDRLADRISFDQEMANQIGKDSLIKSINTGFQTAEAAGGGEHMARVRYSYTGPNQPVTPEDRPNLAFDRLAGFSKPATDPAALAAGEQLRAERLSVLDFVGGELQAANTALGAEDKARLDQYTTSLRELEQAVATQVALSCDQLAPMQNVGNHEDDANLPMVAEQMLKITQHAMQCDVTRVGVFQIKGEQSYVNYGDIKDPILSGAGGNHHGISHHPNHQIGQICRYHSKLVADLATRLDSVSEGTGTMLDNTVILYTNGIENGEEHNFENLPHVLIGGTKVLAGGQAAQFGGNASNNDLFLTLFKAFGVDMPTFGKPDFVNGVLPGLLA